MTRTPDWTAPSGAEFRWTEDGADARLPDGSELRARPCGEDVAVLDERGEVLCTHQTLDRCIAWMEDL